MNSLSLAPFSAACNSLTLPNLKPLYKLPPHRPYITINQKRRIRNGRCRAELSHDAPFVVAIGACVLNSLVFPLPVGPHDKEDGDSVIDSADARFAVMGIISFIPYFNWMSWVFAWMDTMDKRYAFYAIVYLAPYLSTYYMAQVTATYMNFTLVEDLSGPQYVLMVIVNICMAQNRTNLSLSPDESWLPISSIVLCILHIQLEASIKNGDFQNFQLFNGGSKKDARISGQVRRKDEQNLPSANDESRNKMRNWGIPRKPAQEAEDLDEDGEEGKEH